MWIRSQDKEALVFCKDIIYAWYPKKEKEEARHFLTQPMDFKFISTERKSGFGKRLGEYKSKKRSIEVLDEIEEFLDIGGGMKAINDTLICDNAKVYQMPEE